MSSVSKTLTLSPQEMVVLGRLSYALTQSQPQDLVFVKDNHVPKNTHERELGSLLLKFFHDQSNLLRMLAKNPRDWRKLAQHKEFTGKNAIKTIIAMVLILIFGALLYGTKQKAPKLLARTAKHIQQWQKVIAKQKYEWDETLDLELYEKYHPRFQQLDTEQRKREESKLQQVNQQQSQNGWFRGINTLTTTVLNGTANMASKAFYDTSSYVMNQTGINSVLTQVGEYHKETLVYVYRLVYILLFLAITQSYIVLMVTPKKVFWLLFLALGPVYYMLNTNKKQKVREYVLKQFKTILFLCYRLLTRNHRKDLEKQLEELITAEHEENTSGKLEKMKQLFIAHYTKNLPRNTAYQFPQGNEFKVELQHVYKELIKNLDQPEANLT